MQLHAQRVLQREGRHRVRGKSVVPAHDFNPVAGVEKAVSRLAAVRVSESPLAAVVREGRPRDVEVVRAHRLVENVSERVPVQPCILAQKWSAAHAEI